MADNVTLPASGTGTATPVIATDDVGGVHYQRVKPDLGGDGATVAVSVGAGVVDTGTQRTTLASNDPSVTQIGSLTETAPATDTASSGLNGRLQRIAQRITSLMAAIVGPTASGAALTANPLTTGGLAKTALPVAVTDGQVVNRLHDIYGRQIARLTLREQQVDQTTTISSSTAETTILTADATYKLDIYGMILSNTSATAISVTLRDATGAGTARVFRIPAGQMVGFIFTESGALRQAAVNNNWTLTCGTSVAAIEVTVLATKNL